MWTYTLISGRMTNGTISGNGYSGHDPHKNDIGAQNIPNVGPIPVGKYTIGPPFTHPACGPVSMRLSPEPGNQMFDRAGFLIHGDSISRPGRASDGCIILPRDIRQQIADSDDNDLTVV